ncbi:MAG: hypothetical protein ACTSSP_01050 [Candidatus Asgardarchaeia archaeon]
MNKIYICYHCGREFPWDSFKSFNMVDKGDVMPFCRKCDESYCHDRYDVEYYDPINSRFEILDL